MKYRESLNIVNKDLQLPAILAINSSINAEESLSRVFEVLQDFLDADGAFVNIFDAQKHLIVFVAHCRRGGVSSPLGSVEPPKSLRPLKITDKVLNCSDIAEDRFTEKVLSECLPDVKSYLMLSMDKENRHLGVVCFYSRRYDQFNEEQRALLKSLHDSFSLMTSNALNSILLANNEDLMHENDGLKDSVRESRMSLVKRFSARTPSLKEITEKVEKVSLTEVPILVLGETGCGKEVVVNLIQQLSKRESGPFVKLNCGAIPETLIDDEFFGHEKGAFTDAKVQKKGVFERASGGTLFLDEIGELSLAAQVRLLRALQQKVVTRIGGMHSIPVDFRLVAATHRDLKQMTKEGRFRNDLLYRLNLFPIHIPPLRERPEDLLPLTEFFLNRLRSKYGISQPLVLSQKSIDQIQRYKWPGNVRELENTLERSVLTSSDYQNIRVVFEGESGAAGQTKPVVSADPVKLETFELMQKHYFEAVLKVAKGKISGRDGAATLTGMHPNTLRSKLEKLGVAFKAVKPEL